MSQKNNLLVSVVIPTYGRTDFVEEAILSVINQTYKNIEIIVCDDNVALPEIRKKIELILRKYPQCKLIQNKVNLGGSLNRNEGIKNSSGELISFLDDDDIYLPTRIASVVDAYNNEVNKDNIGILYTYCYYSNSDLTIKGQYCIEPSNNPLFKHMLNCLCATSQWTIPKYVFDKVGMFEETPCKQDSIMLLKILGSDFKCLCIPEKLSVFRDHDCSRISENYGRHISGENYYHLWLKKYYWKLTSLQIKQVEANVYRRLLYNYSGMRDYLKIFECIKCVIKNTGVFSIKIWDLIYIIITPEVIKKIKKILRYKK